VAPESLDVTESAALLIDADNLSAEAMARALTQLQERGWRVRLRRAYGSHETLGTIREFLQANSVRAHINHGKGTTDALLVVDAMDLLHTGMLPPVVAIGSGDSDFAPLVVRLREAGHKVICLAQRKKAADGLERFYDEVVHLDELPPQRARKTAAKKAAAPPSVDPVHRVLRDFAGFLEGKELELGPVVKKLRDEKLMGKTTSAMTFFKKHAPDVELLPPKHPNKLRRIVARA
jgi:uncharacterized LabA/DUF88 family protein